MSVNPAIIINVFDIFQGELTSSMREEVNLTMRELAPFVHVDRVYSEEGGYYWFDYQGRDNQDSSNDDSGIDFVQVLYKKIANIRAEINAATTSIVNIYLVVPLYLEEARKLEEFIFYNLVKASNERLIQNFNLYFIGLTSGFANIKTDGVSDLRKVSKAYLKSLKERQSTQVNNKLLVLDNVGITGAAIDFDPKSLSKTIVELVRLHINSQYNISGSFSSAINSFGIGIIELDENLFRNYLQTRIIEGFLFRDCSPLQDLEREKLFDNTNQFLEDLIKSHDQTLISYRIKDYVNSTALSIPQRLYILALLLNKEETVSENLCIEDFYDETLLKINTFLSENEKVSYASIKELHFEINDVAEEIYCLEEDDPDFIRLNDKLEVLSTELLGLKKKYSKLKQALCNKKKRNSIYRRYQNLNNDIRAEEKEIAIKERKGILSRIISFLFFRRTKEQKKISEDFKVLSKSDFEAVLSEFDKIQDCKEGLENFKIKLQDYYSELRVWKDFNKQKMDNLSFHRPRFIRLLFDKSTLDKYYNDQKSTFLKIENTDLFDNFKEWESDRINKKIEFLINKVKTGVESEILESLNLINKFNIYNYFDDNKSYSYLIQGFNLDKEITSVYHAANPFIHCTDEYKIYDEHGNPTSVDTKLSNLYFAPNYKDDNQVNEFDRKLRKIISSYPPSQHIYHQEKFKISFLRVPFGLQAEYLVEWFSAPVPGDMDDDMENPDNNLEEEFEDAEFTVVDSSRKKLLPE